MKKLLILGLGAVLGFTMVCGGMAAAKEGNKHNTVKEVKSLSQQEQVKLALSAAPAHLVKEVGVMVYGADGKLTEARPSTNGFTCIPTVMNLPDPDPMCMDAAVHQWMTDLMNNAPKPTNTVPGIAYMARGGSHFEKDGKVVMSGEGRESHEGAPALDDYVAV